LGVINWCSCNDPVDYIGFKTHPDFSGQIMEEKVVIECGETPNGTSKTTARPHR
jgi:hypothetical protein